MGVLAENENTNRAYLHWMRVFQDWYGAIADRDEAFSQKNVEEFIDSLKANNYSSSSINQAGAAIKKWARMTGHNPEITNKPKIEEKLPEILTQEEIKKLIDSTFDIRNRAILSLMYDTGIRIGELINLDMEDIDLENDWIFIKRRKGGGLPQNIPFHEKTRGILLNYLEERKTRGIDDNALFVGQFGRISISAVSRMVKNGGGIFLGKNIHCHSLRHCKASHLREMGVSIEDIRDFLGHKNIQTTLRYARLNPIELKKFPETY